MTTKTMTILGPKGPKPVDPAPEQDNWAAMQFHGIETDAPPADFRAANGFEHLPTNLAPGLSRLAHLERVELLAKAVVDAYEKRHGGVEYDVELEALAMVLRP